MAAVGERFAGKVAMSAAKTEVRAIMALIELLPAMLLTRVVLC